MMCDWINGYVTDPDGHPYALVSRCQSQEPVEAVGNGGLYCPRHREEFARLLLEIP